MVRRTPAIIWPLLAALMACSPSSDEGPRGRRQSAGDQVASGDEFTLPPPSFPGAGPSAAGPDGAEPAGAIPQAVYACSACHVLPPPGILAKKRWPHMITRMKLLIEDYQLGAPLQPIQVEQILRYYVTQSPAEVPDVVPDYHPSPIAFTGAVLGTPPSADPGVEPPIIGHLNIGDLDQNGYPDVLVSDIRANALTWIALNRQGRWAEAPLAQVTAPARTEVVDLNGDGHLDVVVGSVGSMQPTDDLIGAVVICLGDGRGSFTPRTVLRDVVRVSDVRPVDMDGDGDLDILFAAWGLYKTGRIGWLEQDDQGGYTLHTIYTRNGISHCPVIDLNDDGKPDFMALISQQHEEILAFINQGGGNFESQIVYKGPHPMFGLSNIGLVDLDQDGDLDALFTSGDALDTEPYSKPWHAVHWLENQGGSKFVHHEIERFSGAYSVVSGDLDGDRDLDLVVTSMMNRWTEPERQSIIWLENDGNQSFTPHALSPSPTWLVVADLGDLDRDGDLDIIAGGMYLVEPYYRVGRITVWANMGRQP